MPTLGQTQYLKRNVNGNDVYQTLAYGGNTPLGYEVIDKNSFLQGVQGQIARYDKLKAGGSDPGGWMFDQANYDRLQKSLEEANAGSGVSDPNYRDPSFKDFNPNGQPTESNYTPEKQAEVAKIPSNLGGTGASVPAQSTTSPNPSVLQQGTGSSTAPDITVKAMQQQLGITADGIFGPQTKSAVMAFQQANGLSVDGIVGPITTAALQKAASGAGTTATAPKTTPSATTTTKAPDDPTNQFNTATGLPNPKYINPATGKTTLQETADINTTANTDMEKMIAENKKTLGTNVDVSNSEKLIKALTDSLTLTSTTTKPVETKSLTQQLADKRTELGVDPLETQMTGLDSQIAKLDSDWLALQDKEGNRQVSLGQINRRKSADEIQYSKMKAELNLQKNTIANQLNQKYSVINTFMQFSGQDYQNATAAYNTKFNQAISMINLVKNVEETAKSDAEKKVDNARANAQLMITTLKGSKVDFAKLDPTTIADISKLELASNLPSGFIKFAMTAVDDPVISIGGEFTDAQGNRQVPIYTKNSSTGVVGVKTIVIGTDAGVTDKTKGLEKDVTEAVADFSKSIKEMKWRGINPEMYDSYRQQIFEQYGAAGVTKLDAAIKSAKLVVDYGTSSDQAFKREG